MLLFVFQAFKKLKFQRNNTSLSYMNQLRNKSVKACVFRYFDFFYFRKKKTPKEKQKNRTFDNWAENLYLEIRTNNFLSYDEW